MTFDGSGKLGDALAALLGVSPKNNNKLAALIKQAKDALGITSKAKVLPDEVKRAIYRWHYERINPVTEIVETFSQPETVETFSQVESVEINSQDADNESVNIISQSDGNDTVEINSQYGFNDLVRVAFYTTSGGNKKRQVIALDGFYLNALMLAAGIDKKGIPAWVQQAVDNWPAFDPLLPITRQVKRLIIRALTEQIERLQNAN